MAVNVTEMTERLKDLGILGDIRQRLGAKDGNDTSCDKDIDQMTADELMYAWAGWEFGYGDWWTDMKNKYDRLCKDA